MASFKVSEFTGVANTTDDSLLMLSYTTDDGATYETRKIRIADLFDDIPPTTKTDLDVDDLETLTGMGPGAVNLGVFDGDIIPDNVTIKQALSVLEQNAMGNQEAFTAGDGLDLTSNVLSVDLLEATYETLTVTGQSSFDGVYIRAGQWSLDGATSFSGNALWNENGGYYYFTKDGDNTRILVFNEFDSSWDLLEASSGFVAPVNDAGTPIINGLSTYGGTSTIYENSVSQPTADSTISYSSGISFLEFDGGKLKVSVLDEDNLISDSATNVPTQQSVKAYADGIYSSALTAVDASYLRIDGANVATGALNMGGNLVTNQADPVSGSDSATKSYVDTATAGQGAFWTPVDLHANTNIVLSGEQTIDGVLTSLSRVLVSGQTDATQNGIYVSAAGAWTRAVDADESGEFLTNKTVFVKFGVTSSGHVEAYTGSDSPTLGTDDITFVTKSEAATLADGSVTTAKLADLAVTDAKVNDVAASKITGTLNDATVAESNVTQHEAALSIAFTQLTGTASNAQIPESAVTQHEAALSIIKAQISDFSDADYTSATEGANLSTEQTAIRQSLGTAPGATSLGTFTGSILGDTETVKSAFQVIETTIESLDVSDLTDGANVVKAGDNIDRLIGSTGADGEPAAYLFVVCDQSDGSLKFIDKTFIEIE